jgi:tRNA A37 N6-isopentenylltransferase MiaA
VSEVIALLGGNAFALSLSIEKIINLFPPSEQLDEQIEQLISRMLEKGISQEVVAYVAQVSLPKIQAYVNSKSPEIIAQATPDETDSIE